MAIRSTNANRASKAYNPAAKPQGGVSAGDRADFGQGPPGRMTKQDQIDRRRQEYGDSPWYGKDGNPMPWSGPDGQQRGQRAPMFTPNAGDPRNAGYFKNQSTPEEIAADNAAAAARYRGQQDLLAGNDAYMAAKNAGDLRGQIAAMMAMKQGMQQDRFVAQGGTPETWQNRYQNENNWQRPGVAPSPGGGRTMPPPPAPPPGGRTMPQAVPPMQNPMMEGYNPGVSKSGMGQNPMSGPAMSTGNPMGGMANMPLDLMTRMATGSAGNPMGGGVGDYVFRGDFSPTSFGYSGGGYNPMMGGGGMGGMGFGGFGGFNPYSMLGGGMGMGYNPGAQFSPYMMMGGY